MKVSLTLAKVLEGIITVDTALGSDTLTELQGMKEDWHNSRELYRSAQLWIMYMEMVQILRSFISAAQEIGIYISKHSMKCCHTAQHQGIIIT